MHAVTIDAILNQLFAVLREAFEGPRERWSYFTDNRPEAGLFGTLASLDEAKVSRPLGASTIAAHVNHMIFAMEAAAAEISGDTTPRNWKESWALSTVDAEQWERLLGRLRTAFSALNTAIALNGVESTEAIGASIGALAHSAYHLGAVRQKVLFLKDPR
jgi:hypothetical protein